MEHERHGKERRVQRNDAQPSLQRTESQASEFADEEVLHSGDSSPPMLNTSEGATTIHDEQAYRQALVADFMLEMQLLYPELDPGDSRFTELRERLLSTRADLPPLSDPPDPAGGVVP